MTLKLTAGDLPAQLDAVAALVRASGAELPLAIARGAFRIARGASVRDAAAIYEAIERAFPHDSDLSRLAAQGRERAAAKLSAAEQLDACRTCSEFVALAHRMEQRGDHQRAREALLSAVQRFGTAAAWTALGAFCRRRNELGAARIAIDAALSLDASKSSNPHAWTAACALLRAEDRPAEAVAVARELRRLHPGDPYVENVWGALSATRAA